MGATIKLALRNIQRNFKRTILTILGIIIASALITGVCTIFTSIQRTMVQTIINDRGRYHFVFKDVDINQRKNIYDKFLPDISYEEVETIDKSTENGIENINYSQDAYKNLNIRLKKGNYPTNADEILVALDYAQQNNIVVGDKVKDKKVVGIYSDYRFVSGYDATFLSYVNGKLEGKFNYYIYFNKVNDKLAKEVEKYAKDNNIELIKNNLLLNFSKISFDSPTYKGLAIFMGILLAIIGVAAISLIYNAFSISLNNRRREFAIVGCIGATKKQLKKMVYSEVFILGLIGTTIGILFGVLGIYVTFDIVNRIARTISKEISTNFMFYVNIWTIIGAYVISFITLFIAAIFPARRAKKISLIEAVRGQDAVNFNKRTSKRLKKSYAFSKFLMGYEGLLAKKNIARSKKQYRIITISLVISGIIFLVSSSFMDIMFKSVNEKLKDVDKIMNSFTIYSNNKNDDFSYFMRENGQYLKAAKIYSKTSAVSDDLNIEIVAYKKGSIGEVGKKNTIYYSKEIKNIKAGDTLNLKNGDNNISVKVDNIVKDQLAEFPYIVISEEEFNKVFGDQQYINVIEGNAIDDKATYIADEVDNYATENGYASVNPIKNTQVFRSVKLIVNIFVYGFVGLVSLVSIVNMVNTISSSIQVRTKELGVLRSVGMSKRKMLAMLTFENLFILIKTLVIVLPISLLIHYGLIHSMQEGIELEFFINIQPVIIVIVALIIFTFIPTLYSVLKLRKSQIIESLR